MQINQTGAGFHRDSRKEARMSKGTAKRWAIEEDLKDLDNLDDEPGYWDDRPLFAADADVTIYWPDVRPCYEEEVAE